MSSRLTRLSDPGLLQPAFWERLAPVLKALRGQGFKPYLFETMRSTDRALELVAKGKSKAKGGLSMHCFGLAADVICYEHQWDCARNHCAFFTTYGTAVEDAGLVWGGRWPTIVDLPHCQAVQIKHQNAVRKMKPEMINDFAASVMAGLVR